MNRASSSERLRVLHVITRLIVGGAQENTLFTAAKLDSDRYQVDVVSGPQTGSEGSLIEEARRAEIPLTILPELVRQIDPARDARAFFKLRSFIRRGGYQIVHTHSSKAGVLGRLAAHLEHVPVVVHTVHGWSFHDYMPPVSRQVYQLLERMLARISQALVVVCARDQAKGLEAGIGREEQYRLIRSAIPLDEFSPGIYPRDEVRRELGLKESAPVVGCVGRFSDQKNPLDWIRAAGLVARDCPQAQFLLVGDGPLRSQVETAALEQGIADRLVLTGLRRDPGRMMSAMDVFLLTSLWEGLPRVLPQAMSLELPVVATRADGTSEIIQDGVNGFLCPPGDVECLAECCKSLLYDPLKRLEMGTRARASLGKEFDLGTMIAQIEDLYQELLNKQVS